MAQEDFKLPGSSVEEIEKIIEAYANKAGPSSNEEIAKLAGTGKTQVSRNNGFLVSTGLVVGGNQKETTDLGRKLGMALHHNQEDEVRKYWQRAVAGNAFLSEQLTAIRVQKGVKVDDLPGKILYNAEASKNKATEAGAKAVVDILEKGGLLQVEDGKYVIAKEPPPMEPQEEIVEEPRQQVQPESSDGQPASTAEEGAAVSKAATRQIRVAAEQQFSVAINLQLQLPEFEDTKKYEDLFRALREHLLEPFERD